MKKMVLVMTVVSLMSLVLLPGEGDAIVVPVSVDHPVTINGMFSEGEWDDALCHPVKDGYVLYFKGDAEILYVGLKSARRIGALVCEIRITANEKDVYLLHVSGALAEGFSGFPATSKFDVNKYQLWEANFLKADPKKKEAWVAAGRSMDRYDDMYDKRDGIEFKIYRKKFDSDTLKFTIGWIRVQVEGKKIDKRTYHFPEDISMKNANNWAELVLPALAGQR